MPSSRRPTTRLEEGRSLRPQPSLGTGPEGDAAPNGPGDPGSPIRVLVTNDDGIASPGLHALAEAALGLLADVTVVAPSDEQSGSGTAVGPLHVPGRVVFEAATIPGLPLLAAYRVRCPPALAVLTVGLGGPGVRPDLVLAGVNAGSNLGTAVLHSGTVGAALTAANLGVPAVAVSLATDGRCPRWDTAAAAAVAAARWLAASGLPVALNVNVPNVAVADLAGVRMARLSRFGSVCTALTLGGDDDDPQQQREIELDHPRASPDEESDTALLRLGFVTVTGLRPLGGADLRVSGVVPFVEDELGRGPDRGAEASPRSPVGATN